MPWQRGTDWELEVSIPHPVALTCSMAQFHSLTWDKRTLVLKAYLYPMLRILKKGNSYGGFTWKNCL